MLHYSYKDFTYVDYASAHFIFLTDNMFLSMFHIMCWKCCSFSYLRERILSDSSKTLEDLVFSGIGNGAPWLCIPNCNECLCFSKPGMSINYFTKVLNCDIPTVIN